MDNKPKFIGGLAGMVAAILTMAVPLLLLIALIVWLVRLIVLGVTL